MKRAVREVGYEAPERSEGADALDRERQAREDEIKRQGRNLIIAGTIGLIVMIGTFYDMLGPLKSLCPRISVVQVGHRPADHADRLRSRDGSSSPTPGAA